MNYDACLHEQIYVARHLNSTHNHVSFANVAGFQGPVKYKFILNPTH
jgi:hypothetical protein